jgi:hypothetical protein
MAAFRGEIAFRYLKQFFLDIFIILNANFLHHPFIRKYYLKNNYFILRSKVKVPPRSLQYVTPPYGHTPTYQINTI